MEAGRTNAVKFCQAINIGMRGINAEEEETYKLGRGSCKCCDGGQANLAVCADNSDIHCEWIWMDVWFVGESELFLKL